MRIFGHVRKSFPSGWSTRFRSKVQGKRKTIDGQAGAAADRKFAELLRDAAEALTLREKQEKETLEKDVLLHCALLRQVDAEDGIQSSEDAIREQKTSLHVVVKITTNVLGI